MPENREIRLTRLIFCTPSAIKFTGEPLGPGLALTDQLPKGRRVSPEDLSAQFFSTYIRQADVPVAFLKESEISTSGSIGNSTAMPSGINLGGKLGALGRSIQYEFSDGLVLFANQILYHRYSKNLPRHLLPLTINVTSEIRDQIRSARKQNWESEAELTQIAILMGAQRLLQARAHVESIDQGADKTVEKDELFEIVFTFQSEIETQRSALRLERVRISAGAEWGPWRLSTSIHEPHNGTHYGRARIELDPERLGNLDGLAKNFLLDRESRTLTFHGFEEQLERLKVRLGALANESGLSLHISGHAQIQIAIHELSDLFGIGDRPFPIHPTSFDIPNARITPRLSLTGDGSFRMRFDFPSHAESWEAHGLPQSSMYILHSLQNGLGATTGFANAQIAHLRKGLKRERDLKILRNLGYASMIFFDAASFALGLPLSDGTIATSEEAVAQSLYERLGAQILKSEGWPTQTGTLAELCSKNVTALVEGFIKQVVMDLNGREVTIFLPEGKLSLQGLTRPVTLLLYAIVADLAHATGGLCFTKARTKYFENFLAGRMNPEREDLVLRHSVDAETSAKMIYQAGINERFQLPVEIQPTRSVRLLGLLNHGFQISIDGKEVEQFESADFRPEFTLDEGSNTESTDSPFVATGTHKINWFELHPKFFFKGVEISGDQAARLSREGLIEFEGRLYRIRDQDLPSLKRLTRFWAGIQGHQIRDLDSKKRRKTEDTFYQLPKSRTLDLLALRATGVKMHGGPRWEEICRFYDSLDQARPELKISESFKTELQPYQRAGVQWINDLYELGLGGILADDMGLGKTVTSLAFLENLRSRGRLGATLVVVPTSLTYNWFSEAARFTPSLPVVIFSSRETDKMLDAARSLEGAVIISTYGLLQEHIEVFQQVQWNSIILDEAQNLKNITTKRTTAARKLEADFKICLTGTPIENHYGELYSLFDLIVPGSLGDIAQFRERFVNPPRVLREDIDDLKLKVKPLILRRTKSQVMHELPPKVETTVKLPFDDEQKKIYRDIASAYNEQVRTAIASQGEAKSQLQMLTALLRLRQVCSDPSSVPGIVYHGEPPKVSTLVEALEEITESGASALVFTQFLATFERIRQALTQSKIAHFDINGSDSRLAREKKIKAFQEEAGGAVMLMTLKTGGVGLNLVKASYIFHIEPWWNPAVENQATDRAHRIGQTKTVQVYRYLIKDSVEEKIEILKDIKSKRFDAMFAVSESTADLQQASSALTQQDFEFLLS